jgi:hypothetical protein
MDRAENRRPIPRILHGEDEPIFAALPESVLANLRTPRSENALLWNRIYPLAQPTIALGELLKVRPLWGAPTGSSHSDDLRPFFWGYDVAGEKLGSLDDVLLTVDGPGNPTEVDLFLVGAENLVLVEAKHMSTFGRCGRYARARCPEIHRSDRDAQPCRYWAVPDASFATQLNIGDRPTQGFENPACDRHYQLGRTLLVGEALAERLGLRLHIWVFIPGSRWRALERDWLDFTQRVRAERLWRRLRVISWEALRTLKAT